MPGRESLDPMGNPWHLIAVQVRRHREERKMSGSALGVLLDIDRSTVSRIESGDIKLKMAHARIIDRTWLTDGLFSVLVHMALTGHKSEWLQFYLELEARASHLWIWENSWIHGLFQTPAYARAVFECFGLEDIDRLIDNRMARQQALDRKPRPLIWAYLYDDVIASPVGSAEIMREQLTRLLELAERPNITIRVLPRGVGAHVGRDGAFQIMTVAGGDQLFTQASQGGRLTTDSEAVDSARVNFTRIGDNALPVDASLKFIRETMEKFE